MLNRLDEFFVHQTPEPLAYPATSDPDFYERLWFNGYDADASAYFGAAMAVCPHRKVLDCAFSMVTRGGRQFAFFGSRLAPQERTDLAVGPFRVEVEEPLRRVRVILDENSTGLACDLTFTAHTAPITESRQVLWSDARRVMDVTRFDQFGFWNGTVRSPESEHRVDSWYGTKDRSWGVRGVGEQVTTGFPKGSRRIFFMWAPLIWDQGPGPARITHAIFFDDPRGRALVREGIVAPFHADPSDIGPPSAGEERFATVRHRMSYRPGTRLAESAEIDMVPHDGPVTTIRLEPLLRFHMKGLGYSHPTRRMGTWHGELDIAGEVYDPDTLDLTDPVNVHVQQVVRASEGNRVGIGALEQQIQGPYALIDGPAPAAGPSGR